MLEWLESVPPAVWLQNSGTAYLIVNAVHIAAIGTLVGVIVALDLRLLGVLKTPSLIAIGRFLSRYAASALALGLITGLWLFAVQPFEYTSNPAFLAKIALVAAGILNALGLHAGSAWASTIDTDAPPGRIRAHAAASILIWPAALLAGRWIAFV